jgi:hypothetical protein
MGCGMFKRPKKTAKYYFMNFSLSKVKNPNSEKFVNVNKRKSKLEPIAPNYFWVTSPYYFLCNRMNHLRIEIQDDEKFKAILKDVIFLLEFLINEFYDTNVARVKLKKFTLSWVREYENSYFFIKAIGLKLKGKELRVIQRVTFVQLMTKLREVRFFFNRFNVCNFLFVFNKKYT